ncbi:MAG: hypothetical protein JWP88_279, partial [Flaviaesturariibacter sp.]|nr:hypothetical protein [Flaviaesturariibacter sp.]
MVAFLNSHPYNFKLKGGMTALISCLL